MRGIARRLIIVATVLVLLVGGDFADFQIEPPSVAGVVTVEDRGTLELKLRLQPTG
jgi:hypothetical protein